MSERERDGGRRELCPIGRAYGRHSSAVSSAPTILQPRVRILSTPSMLFAIFIVEI